ncbi:hypothetical protein H6P81_005050 [Aristolochia fimbriata]|uniref:SWIM-type domain-containing protein n=1 Tax=Aristolochia fimbriata TaxID=158543 RepID=A0AAV7EWW9_ARIFI|nr:hypothetical protein H6P81_005050 [Aristolochia fimbriata]
MGSNQSLELFVKRDTYSYEMDSRRSLENVGGSVEGAVVVYGGQAPAEGDDRVESPNAEFIPEESFALVVDEVTLEFREPCEDANDNSSSEESWPNSVREEVEEEEEDVELPLPTMGVPPLEENDAPYPDPWIGVMDMDVTYRNTMVPGVDDDNVPPPVGIGVGQRFMTKDALVMHLKDYCISRHVHSGDQCSWHVYASFSMKLNMWKIRRCNDEHTCLNVELRMTTGCAPLQAWRARNKALVAVFGGWDESYNLLPQFFKAIKDTNRGTKYKVITTEEGVTRGNFVVRGRSPMCIISNRHSGIIRAIRDVFPRPHRHRFCIRHIIANLKKRYSVKDLNKMVWRCASAETVAHYDHEMQILEEVCPGAKAELTEDLSPEQWALAYDGNMSFGKLTTNSSESVNSLLKWARNLPVQALASAIFYRMNAWFVHRRDKAAEVTTHLCPSVDAHLRSVVDDARHVHVVAYGDGIFQAGEYWVNIMLKECSCRSFQIYQVPCVHAIAVCGAIHYDIHQMTSAYYYASTNARVYERPFDVPTRRNSWVQDGRVVLPPGPKRTPGRPMSTRIQNSMDWRDDDRGRYLCSNCKQPGHNKRACRDGGHPIIVRSGLPQERVHLAWGDSTTLADGRAAVAVCRGRRVWCTTQSLVVETGQTADYRTKDVAVLLGLLVDGDAVTGLTRGDWMELARVLLGVELPPGSFQGGRLSLSWLRGQFSFCLDDATELVIQQHAYAFLLHLVGATIFSDGSARGVHMAYLTLFKDFEEVGRYSWGAGTLAFLYRELAKACRTGVVGIAGCLTLMQLWAWERLHTGRSTLLQEPELQGGPLGSRWNVRRTNATNPGGNLVLYRSELDHRWSYRWVVYGTWLSCVNHRAALYPSSTHPHWLEIGQDLVGPVCGSSTLGGSDRRAKTKSHAGEPSYVGAGLQLERRLRVEDYDEVPAAPKSTVLHLPRGGHTDTEPGPPFEQPLEQPIEQPQEEPSRHPPIRRIYTRRQKKAIGAPEPSSAL